MKAFLLNLLNSGITDKQDQSRLLRVRFLNILLLIAAVVFFVYLVIYSTRHDLSNEIVNFIFGGLTFFNFIYLRTRHNLKISSFIALLNLIITLCSILITGGFGGTGIFWFFVFPVVAFSLLKRKSGLFWIGSLVSAVIVVKLLAALSVVNLAYNNAYIIQLLVVLVVVTLIIYVFQNLNEHNEYLITLKTKELVEANENLSVQVNEKSVAEQKLQKSFSEIDRRNTELESTKIAMLNVLEDAKELQTKLKEEKENVELRVQERTTELQDEQGKLQASINSLNVGFVMTDVDFNVVNINSTAKRILCLNDLRTLLQDPSSIGSNCSLEDIEKNLKNVLDLRENIKKCLTEKNLINIDNISFNKRILHFFLSPIALYREKLNIIGVVILVEDVTEAKILARSKDEFFSIASHELRTPLTAIRGNTALMKDYYFDKIQDKDLKVMIGDIHESSVRLIQIVNDFLDTSRLEQGRIEFHNEDFDLPTVIEEVIKELEPTLAAAKLYLKLQPSAVPIPLIIADRNRVKQILINLIGNAIKFTEEGGIKITLTPNNTLVKISVTDTGKGLSDENKNLLFRKFQQAENNILTRDSTRGTGLGLYISKLLTEGMGGRIYLEDSEENKGSTFSFELPAVAKTKVFVSKEEIK